MSSRRERRRPSSAAGHVASGAGGCREGPSGPLDEAGREPPTHARRPPRRRPPPWPSPPLRTVARSGSPSCAVVGATTRPGPRTGGDEGGDPARPRRAPGTRSRNARTTRLGASPEEKGFPSQNPGPVTDWASPRPVRTDRDPRRRLPSVREAAGLRTRRPRAAGDGATPPTRGADARS